MARRAYRQDVGMVLKKTRLGGFFVGREKVSLASQYTFKYQSSYNQHTIN